MIRAIVAIDEKRGMANDTGIPWDLPSDRQYFRDHTESGVIVMGYGTYKEFKAPFHSRTNYIATSQDVSLKPGFEPIHDARAFLQQQQEDTWVIGGAGLLATTLDLIDELYITQLKGDFNCTKFFPEYKNEFVLVTQSEPHTQNGITFCFEVWKRK